MNIFAGESIIKLIQSVGVSIGSIIRPTPPIEEVYVDYELDDMYDDGMDDIIGELAKSYENNGHSNRNDHDEHNDAIPNMNTSIWPSNPYGYAVEFITRKLY